MSLRTRRLLASLIVPMLLTAPHAHGADAPSAPACDVPLFEGLGGLHYPVTTRHKLSQRYFDQGLTLSYGFNHAEAERSFRKAADLDPSCAMCYWGTALVLGPNINAPMNPAANEPALAALAKAKEHMAGASEREKALILALEKRYASDPAADRPTLDKAYMDAMAEVAHRFPDDVDIQSLYAEAMMDTSPWRYWTADRQPKPLTQTILATLERALTIAPNHPGANHFYVHAVEAVRPKLAEKAADRLVNLVPGAGHLVHMASHIYLRVGRYHDAVLTNQKAIAADEAYLAGCHAPGMYEAMYALHNYDFLIAAAYLEGRSELAIETARQLKEMAERHLTHMPDMYDLQHFWANLDWALLRFGKWQDILAQPEPPQDLLYARTLRHHARAMALTRLGRLHEAEAELKILDELAADPRLDEILIMGLNKASAIVAIGVAEVRGELAAARGCHDAAISSLEQAVSLQDALIYIEPPSWYHSVRLALGEILIAAGRPAQAGTVFLEDLKEFPANGWALRGLERSFIAQGDDTQAAWARREFRHAWRYADFELDQARP